MFFLLTSVLLLWDQQPRQTLGPSMTFKLSVVVYQRKTDKKIMNKIITAS